MKFSSGKIWKTIVEVRNAFGLVLAFAFYDSVIGSGISAAVWANLLNRQLVVDVYQFGFFALIFLTMYLLSALPEWKNTLYYTIILLVGSLEDTFYFVLEFISKYAVFVISAGRIDVEPGFPDKVGTYIGWISRFFGGNLTLPLTFVFYLNILAIIAVTLLAWREVRTKEN